MVTETEKRQIWIYARERCCDKCLNARGCFDACQFLHNTVKEMCYEQDRITARKEEIVFSNSAGEKI